MKVESTEKPETYRSFTMVCLRAFSISLSFFYLGYTSIYYSTIPPETISRLYHIETDVATAEGVLNGVSSIGGLMGCLFSSFIIKNLSRRNCLLVLDGCSIVFGILIFIPNLYAFILFRIGQGLCIGAFSSITPLYLKEITPIEVSGMIGNFSQLGLGLGALFVQFLSYILKKITGDQSGEEFWIIIFGFTLLTQTLQILLLVFFFPYETPKYHLLHHQKKACQDLIRIIYKDEHFQEVYQQKLADVSSFIQPDQEENSAITKQTPIHQEVIPMAALVAVLLTSMQQFSGGPGMTLYSGQIGKKVFTGEMRLVLPQLLTAIIIVFTIISFLYLHRFGRKSLIVTGFILAAAVNSVVAFGFSGNSGGSPMVIFGGIMVFMMIYGATLGPVGWAYLPQIVPPSAMPYIVSFNWISYGIVAAFFPIVTEHVFNGNPSNMFLFFAITSALSAVFFWKFMIQTKDKTDKQIMSEYKALNCC